MAIPKKLISYLEKKKVKYEPLPHRTVFTAWDLSQTLHEDPKNSVKSLVVKLQGKDPVLVLLPSDKNLDIPKLIRFAKNWLKNPTVDRSRFSLTASTVSKITFATEQWLKEKLIGKPGATPAFAGALKLPLFYDRSLLKRPYLIVASGSWEDAIKLSPRAFFAAEEGFSGSFTATKPKPRGKKKVKRKK